MSNFRKYGLYDAKEKIMIGFILLVSVFIGVLHFENLTATPDQKYLTPFLLPSSDKFILTGVFGGDAMDSGRQAFGK